MGKIKLYIEFIVVCIGYFLFIEAASILTENFFPNMPVIIEGIIILTGVFAVITSGDRLERRLKEYKLKE